MASQMAISGCQVKDLWIHMSKWTSNQSWQFTDMMILLLRDLLQATLELDTGQWGMLQLKALTNELKAHDAEKVQAKRSIYCK